MTLVSAHLLARTVWPDGTAWVFAQVVLVTALLTALAVKVVLQGAARSPHPKLLSALDALITPLLIVFFVVVLERFRILGY